MKAIKPVSESNFGEYKCIFENDLGRIHNTVFLKQDKRGKNKMNNIFLKNISDLKAAKKLTTESYSELQQKLPNSNKMSIHHMSIARVRKKYFFRKF